MTDNDIRKRIYEEQKNQIEQDMAPFGFIADGLDDESFVDKDGERWYADEYGDRSYMWDYMQWIQTISLNQSISYLLRENVVYVES